MARRKYGTGSVQKRGKRWVARLPKALSSAHLGVYESREGAEAALDDALAEWDKLTRCTRCGGAGHNRQSAVACPEHPRNVRASLGLAS